MNLGAYGAELVRGSIQAVPRGQYEAALALNMSPYKRMTRIILPQALLIMLPPWGNLLNELHYACYLSEVYRAGLDSVPKGQWEACKALNLSPVRTYFRIIPQALPPSLPGMGNYLVGIFKDTPMLSVIGVAN